MGPSRECDGDWRKALAWNLRDQLQWGRRVNATETSVTCLVALNPQRRFNGAVA